MRYSIIGSSVEQVEGAGGKAVKDAGATGIIFAELEPAGAAHLQSLGARVKPVGEVKTDIVSDPVMPPAPIPVEEGYLPLDLLAAIGFTDQWRYVTEPPLYGEGFGIAILDSGVRLTHELVNGRVVYSKNFTASPSGDGFNHGTGVAAIAAAIAPQCDIIDIKVIGDDGLGTDEAVIMGISEVISLRENSEDIFPYVINLSLGKEDDGDPFDPLRVACRTAIDKGIFVTAAAGNFGPQAGSVMSPASERYVAAAGSIAISYDSGDTGASFMISDFSSRGPTREGLIKPDFVLPGERIIMADGRSDSATFVKSGTSFAAPFGAAMLVLQAEGTMKQARLRLEQWPALPQAWVPVTPAELIDKWAPLITVKPAGAPRGKDVEYGWGIPYGELAALAITGGLPSAVTGDIAAMLTPVLGIGVMGMLLSAMTKAVRRQ